MSNEQKVAIITGASQGIGAGLVKAYRDNGFVVVANSRSIKPSSDEGIIAIAGTSATAKSPHRWLISQSSASGASTP
jgi:NAD(P)-dependent dehydrogenase (short-subunit alcohol dehydrogenase family)